MADTHTSMNESRYLLHGIKVDGGDVEKTGGCPRSPRAGGRRRRGWMVVVGAIVVLAALAVLAAIGGRHMANHKDLDTPAAAGYQAGGANEQEEGREATSSSSSIADEKKVQVEFFVMSRCPDAVKMEQTFSRVVDAVHSIMEVQLSFIARLDPNATTGAVCKHGEYECLGNIDELCALRHRLDLPSFWRFLGCVNSRVEDIGRGRDLALRCASAAGLDTAAFLACTNQGEGRALFRQSVENAVFAGVETSATVFVAGKKRCVEDGGWRECPGGYRPEDFIRDICAAYKGSAPPPSICAQYPRAV
ncbi:hypothetical protein H4217_006312 [Coemansia sp. RSA 1939]|nr:hypothetical protein H4217_006312 [Coemansia sp. RSA 1939]KAJ2610799.1 hypothetical protein EV177_003793 [Coemansia sp. RSA 1804]